MVLGLWILVCNLDNTLDLVSGSWTHGLTLDNTLDPGSGIWYLDLDNTRDLVSGIWSLVSGSGFMVLPWITPWSVTWIHGL